MLKLFFSGIGGSGMSAIAGFMADRGHRVVGSDRLFDAFPDHPICTILKAKGAVIVPQDGSGIDRSFDAAIFSTAVEDNQPEVVKARRLGIPMKTRPEYLAEIVSAFRAVAVAGTSGKSTTAGMLAFLMKQLGLQPNFIGGGRVRQFKTQSNPGNSLAGSSDLLVIEACESDGSIVDYRPFFSIIANVSLDHNTIEETSGMFETLGRNTKEIIVVNSDDPHLSRCHFENPVWFSVDTESAYRPEAVEYHPLSTTFRLHGEAFRFLCRGNITSTMPFPVLRCLRKWGYRLRDISGVLPEFSGIERRFDIHLNDGRHLVIDDYAHNPHKIASLMETIKSISPGICYIFQPHGFGPTRLMKQGYIDTFLQHLRREDHLILLPIYYAGGTSQKDIASEDLLDEILKAGKSAEVLPDRKQLFDRLQEWDHYVVFGARDDSLSDFAKEIAMRLK